MKYNLYKTYLVFHLFFSQTLFAENKLPIATADIDTITPYTLFFNPHKNNVRLSQQKIEYELINDKQLRLGPFMLYENQISIQTTGELARYEETGFGFDKSERFGTTYVVSFNWPVDFIPAGTIEMINDRGRSLWRRRVTSLDLEKWQKARTSANIPQAHKQATFGLTQDEFSEIPINQIFDTFRVCVSEDIEDGRMALCSKRYKFLRYGGRYSVLVDNTAVTPGVRINDREVTKKGTAIFIAKNVPIKFSAMLSSGSYFEFISNPREFKMSDLILSENREEAQIVGFGDQPMNNNTRPFSMDTVHQGLLNFLPTIGDLRKFWLSRYRVEDGGVYLRGSAGMPFYQGVDYKKMPTVKARLKLFDTTTKSTYLKKPWLRGHVHPDIQIRSPDSEVERPAPNQFRWRFLAPKVHDYNVGVLDVIEDGQVYKAEYSIFRGQPGEITARLAGVATGEGDLIILGELGFQYWFESLLWMENYYLSHQRWGISVRQFEAFVGTNEYLKEFSTSTADLKYRFTPGVWARDPTLGVMASAMQFNYHYDDKVTDPLDAEVPLVGGGVFWARSMPKFLDDFLNVLPAFRFPKWVDWEYVIYPVALKRSQRSKFNAAMNFRGKVQWSKNFFGEATFGLKSVWFSDTFAENTYFEDNPFLFTYGTVGIGFSF